MADRTVRTIYEARVAQAQRGLVDLARDTDKAADAGDRLTGALDKAGKAKVDPKIDVDIAAAEKQVKAFTKDLEDLTSQRTEADIDADITKAQKKRATLVTELEILGRMDPSPKVDADTAKAQKQLGEVESRLNALDGLRAEAVADADVSNAQKNLERAEADLKALQGRKAEMIVTVDADSVEESLDGMGAAAESAGDDAGKRSGSALMDGLSNTPIVGVVAGLVAAVGIGVGAGLTHGFQAIAAEDVFGAQMGLDDATQRRFGAAAGEAYSNAWGESVQDNLATSKTALENSLIDADATGPEIQRVIEQLTAVSDVMDVDVREAAEAAGNMMKNGLAKNAEEAFDVIIRGQQEGLNRSDDWIDTLREYSGMFESLGLTGAEAGGLIEQAMDAGARNSDVAADALKEFSIRAQDDSKTTRQAFEDLGLDADEMGAKISKGGDDAKEGLDQVLDGLRGIEDPMARNAAGVALFGTMWEDMGNGAAVLGMDLDDLSGKWVNVGDTTQDAMTRMSDNAASAWESVKRDLGQGLSTLLGGLASSVEEPLQNLAGWVSSHKADILGFLIDVGHGFFDLARAAVEFAATTIEVMGDVSGSLDGITRGVGKTVEAFGHMTGDQDMINLGESIQGAADDLEWFAENADEAAEVIRTEVNGSLDEAEQKFTEWTGPALAQAELDDAITGMVSRLDEFVGKVGGADATLTVNGETLPAEEALNSLIEETSQSNGYLTINGETVKAEDALDEVIRLANEGEGEITITANTGPAREEWQALWEEIGYHPPQMPIEADTTPAEGDVELFTGTLEDRSPGVVPVTADVEPAEEEIGTIAPYAAGTDPTVTVTAETEDAKADIGYAAKDQNSTIDVDADTASANSEIDSAARDRTATIRVVTTGLSSLRAWGAGFAEGGRVPGGALDAYTSGYGVVPGPRAPYGVDNVLWPSYAPVAEGRATGGPTLSQPLAGGEWVVNPISSQVHDATLRAINSGASRAELAAMLGAQQSGAGLQLTQNISGLTAYDVARESTTQMRHVVREQAVPLTGG